MTDACDFCSFADDPPARDAAHLTDHWRVTAHRSALAGWMLVMPLRHIETLADLTEQEAAELGPILRTAAKVQEREFGALKSYVMQFAEGVKHAHFSVAPRRADLPADRKGAAISAYNAKDEPLSEAERDEIALRIRAAWSISG